MARSELERLEGGVHVARAETALQRLLACTLVVQTCTAIAVCVAIVVCTMAIVETLRDVDLNVVQAAISSALRSVENVEVITASVKSSVGLVVGVVNHTSDALVRLTGILDHPTIKLEG